MAATKKFLMFPWLFLFHCRNLSFAQVVSHSDVNRNESWRPVEGTNGSLYVYSAFLDARVSSKPVIMVIAAVLNNDFDAIICNIKLLDFSIVTVQANVKINRENSGFPDTGAAFLVCPLSGLHPRSVTGAAVSITTLKNTGRFLDSTLMVLSTQRNNSFGITGANHGDEYIVHLCTPPFNGRTKYEVNRLIEWFEINRLLGVSRFYVYNSNATDKVRCLLEDYQQKGLVDMRDWSLDIKDVEMGRLTLQTAALNDCLYRSMLTADHLVIIETDEVIIPHRNDMLQQVLSELRLKDLKVRSSAYTFRSVSFYTFWPDDPTANSPLLIARKTLRTEKPLSTMDRSKYIVRSQDAVELGSHFVWQFLNETESVCEVSTDNAMLHRYQNKCNDDQLNCLVDTAVLDRTAKKYTSQLSENVIRQKLYMYNKLRC